jgi:uncharacterized membrane protein YagU involved in acid resistance
MKYNNHKWKSIFITALIAGTLDITAACINAYHSAKIPPDIILKYIASGAFGNAAFSGGVGMMMYGILFHFIIAFACTVTFFLLYPKLSFLKHSIFLNAVLIGIIAWFVTTIIIIPLSKIPPNPIKFSQALIAILILIICIGLPVAYAAKKYFSIKKQTDEKVANN